jgi:hypothetical protein
MPQPQNEDLLAFHLVAHLVRTDNQATDFPRGKFFQGFAASWVCTQLARRCGKRTDDLRSRRSIHICQEGMQPRDIA